MSNRILIYDCSNLVIRFCSTMGSAGKSKIISAMLNNIRVEVNNRNVNFVVMAFDHGSSEFRKKLFPEYKAQRKAQREKTPADVKATELRYEIINEFIEVCRTIGLPVFYSYGIEADDLISFAATYSADPVTIISTDKDFLQLVSERITVYSPVKQIEYKPRTILKDLPYLKPSELKAYLVMTKVILGDKSDNLPNIPKIGEVKAAGLLERFFTKKLTDDDRKLFLEHKDLLQLNRQLVDLTQLPLDFQDKIFKELLKCLKIALEFSKNSEKIESISEKYTLNLNWVKAINSDLLTTIKRFISTLTYSKVVEGEEKQ